MDPKIEPAGCFWVGDGGAGAGGVFVGEDDGLNGILLPTSNVEESLDGFAHDHLQARRWDGLRRRRQEADDGRRPVDHAAEEHIHDRKHGLIHTG